MQNPKINTTACRNLSTLCNKKHHLKSVEKDELFNKRLWDNWKKTKLDLFLTLHNRNKFQMNQRSIYNQENYKY